MGKQTGITRYTCDRCGTTDYLLDSTSAASDWGEVQYILSGGVPTGRLLCKDCHAEWGKYAKTQDAGFNQFMSGKDKNKEGQGQ